MGNPNACPAPQARHPASFALSVRSGKSSALPPSRLTPRVQPAGGASGSVMTSRRGSAVTALSTATPAAPPTISCRGFAGSPRWPRFCPSQCAPDEPRAGALSRRENVPEDVWGMRGQRGNGVRDTVTATVTEVTDGSHAHEERRATQGADESLHRVPETDTVRQPGPDERKKKQTEDAVWYVPPQSGRGCSPRCAEQPDAAHSLGMLALLFLQGVPRPRSPASPSSPRRARCTLCSPPSPDPRG